MFAHFTLPNVPDVARRTVGAALVVGAAVLVGAVSFGHALFGLGACLGMAFGLLNMRMAGNSVAKVAAEDPDNKRRPLAFNAVGRLAIVTVVALGLCFLSYAMGIGLILGVALFQLLFLVNVARSMAKAGPMGSVDEVVGGPVVEGTAGPTTGGRDDLHGGA